MSSQRRIWLGAIAAFMLALVLFVIWGYRRVQSHLIGPEHSLALRAIEPFLSESMALVYAREALQLDGFNPEEWEVFLDDRTTAPNGVKDRFLSRNGLNPNRGMIRFTKPDAIDLFVTVEVIGERVICHVSRGK